MVSQTEMILRVITLWFLVLSQFFLETVWVPLNLIVLKRKLISVKQIHISLPVGKSLALGYFLSSATICDCNETRNIIKPSDQ